MKPATLGKEFVKEFVESSFASKLSWAAVVLAFGVSVYYVAKGYDAYSLEKKKTAGRDKEVLTIKTLMNWLLGYSCKMSFGARCLSSVASEAGQSMRDGLVKVL